MQFIDLKSQFQKIEPILRNNLDLVLESQAFIQGPQVSELESALGEFCGASHVVSCANGTDALQLALMSAEIGPGDAVFVPSFTYTATAEVVLLLGASPVFVDSDPATYNIDFDDLEKKILAITSEGRLNPKVLMTVDLFGQPVDYSRARDIATRHDMLFISDAAQGFGADLNGYRVGSNLADITTTSFFPAKPLGCYGDGGAIFVEDGDRADLMRSIALHGKGAQKYEVVRVGINSRLDTMQAAVLLAKMSVFDSEIERRNEIAAHYNERLDRVVDTPLLAPERSRFAWAQYTIKLDKRDSVQASLRDRGVPTAVYYPLPMHLQHAYRDFGDGEGSLPSAEALSQSVLSLPMHPYQTETDINSVCDALLAAIEEEASA